MNYISVVPIALEDEFNAHLLTVDLHPVQTESRAARLPRLYVEIITGDYHMRFPATADEAMEILGWCKRLRRSGETYPRVSRRREAQTAALAHFQTHRCAVRAL